MTRPESHVSKSQFRRTARRAALGNLGFGGIVRGGLGLVSGAPERVARGERTFGLVESGFAGRNSAFDLDSGSSDASHNCGDARVSPGAARRAKRAARGELDRINLSSTKQNAPELRARFELSHLFAAFLQTSAKRDFRDSGDDDTCHARQKPQPLSHSFIEFFHEFSPLIRALKSPWQHV